MQATDPELVSFRLVFGLKAVTGLGELLLLSVVDLSLFVVGDMSADVIGSGGGF